MLRSALLRRRPTSIQPSCLGRAACRALCTSPPSPSPEDRLAEASPFADAALRGVGQVVFCNSPVSGGAMLAALAMGDPWLAALASVGVSSATASARLTGQDASMISAGLAGYNGCLVGCAFSVFLGGACTPHDAGRLAAPRSTPHLRTTTNLHALSPPCAHRVWQRPPGLHRSPAPRWPPPARRRHSQRR